MKKNNKKGFTIVELVIVIAVIAILAAVMIPTFGGIIDKANASKAMQEARNSYTAYLMAHPSEKIDYVKSGTTYYDLANDFAAGTEAPASGKVVYEIGKCALTVTGSNCTACGGAGTKVAPSNT